MSNNLYIVPYDFTPVSDKAVQYALFLGGHIATEIRLVHFATNESEAIKRRKEFEAVKENNGGLIAIAYHYESLLPQFDSFAQDLITNKLGLPVLIVNSKLASALYF